MSNRVAGLVVVGVLAFGACGESGSSSPEVAPVTTTSEVPATTSTSQQPVAKGEVDLSPFPPECGVAFVGNFSLAAFSGIIKPEDYKAEYAKFGDNISKLIQIMGGLGVHEVQLDGDNPDLQLTDTALLIDPNFDERYDPVEFPITDQGVVVDPADLVCKADDGTLYKTAVAVHAESLIKALLPAS